MQTYLFSDLISFYNEPVCRSVGRVDLRMTLVRTHDTNGNRLPVPRPGDLLVADAELDYLISFPDPDKQPATITEVRLFADPAFGSLIEIQATTFPDC